MLKRKFAAPGVSSARSSIVAVFGGSGFQALLNALAALLVTALIDPGDRGVMVQAIAVTGLVSPILALGVNNSYKFMSAQEGSANLKSTYSFLAVACSAFAGLASMATMWAIGHLGGTSFSLTYFIGCLIFTVALTLKLFVTDAWFASGRFKQGTSSAVFSAAVGFICVSGALPFTRDGAVLLLIQSAGTLFGVLACLLPAYKARIVVAPGYHNLEARTLLRKGVSPMLWSVSVAVVGRTDRIILAFFVSPETVAVYALAVTVAESVRIGASAVSQVFIRRASSSKSLASVGRFSFMGLVLAAVLGGCGIGGLYVLTHLALPPVYLGSVGIAAILCVGEMLTAVYFVSGRGLQAVGRSRPSNFISVLLAIAAIPAYLLGSAFGGVIGLALAACFLYAAAAITSFAIARSHSKSR